jgi:hypothetical protein
MLVKVILKLQIVRIPKDAFIILVKMELHDHILFKSKIYYF